MIVKHVKIPFQNFYHLKIKKRCSIVSEPKLNPYDLLLQLYIYIYIYIYIYKMLYYIVIIIKYYKFLLASAWG